VAPAAGNPPLGPYGKVRSMTLPDSSRESRARMRHYAPAPAPHDPGETRVSRIRRRFRHIHESAPFRGATTDKGRRDRLMKYMLMMNARGGGAWQVGSWSKQDFAAHIGFMKRFDKELRSTGELVSAEGLAGPDQAKLVRATPSGIPDTDGVFPESKEFLAGYWIVDVESRERAFAIAAQASAAPGPGGLPLNMPIEVREVMSGPPDDTI
jgi:hypothetical protein